MILKIVKKRSPYQLVPPFLTDTQLPPAAGAGSSKPLPGPGVSICMCACNDTALVPFDT